MWIEEKKIEIMLELTVTWEDNCAIAENRNYEQYV